MVMSFTVKLIECVKTQPILYDPRHPDFKHFHEKNKVWKQIAKELKQNSNELKKKWKNIKDSYQKHLKTLNTASSIYHRYRNWQWATQMEFCRPFLEPPGRNSDNNSNAGNPIEALCTPTGDSECFEKIHENTSSSKEEFTCNRKKRKKDTGHAACAEDEGQSKLQTQPQHIISSDATDLIFLGYSQTIKKFSPMRQAIAKMRVAQIIMEEEIHNLEEATGNTNKTTAKNKERASISQPRLPNLNTEILLNNEDFQTC